MVELARLIRLSFPEQPDRHLLPRRLRGLARGPVVARLAGRALERPGPPDGVVAHDGRPPARTALRPPVRRLAPVRHADHRPGRLPGPRARPAGRGGLWFSIAGRAHVVHRGALRSRHPGGPGQAGPRVRRGGVRLHRPVHRPGGRCGGARTGHRRGAPGTGRVSPAGWPPGRRGCPPRRRGRSPGRACASPAPGSSRPRR